MNAPVKIDRRVTAYEPTVTALLPETTGRELELRCRILLARDTAAFSLSRGSGGEADRLHAEIEHLASRYAFAPTSVERLELLLGALRHMMQAVVRLNELDDAEGTGGRG